MKFAFASLIAVASFSQSALARDVVAPQAISVVQTPSDMPANYKEKKEKIAAEAKAAQAAREKRAQEQKAWLEQLSAERKAAEAKAKDDAAKKHPDTPPIISTKKEPIEAAPVEPITEPADAKPPVAKIKKDLPIILVPQESADAARPKSGATSGSAQ